MLAHLVLIAWSCVAAPQPTPTPNPTPTPTPAPTPTAAKLIVDVVGNADITVLGTAREGVRARTRDGEVGLRKDGSRIEVVLPANADDAVVEVPKDAEVRVRTRSGDVEIRGVEGHLVAATTAGDVAILGRPAVVEVETVAGDVEVEHTGQRLKVRTVSGDLTAKSAVGIIDIKVTSGDVSVANAQGHDVRISTMSGEIRYAGFFSGVGSHELRTYQGDADLVLSTKHPLVIEAMTMSGHVRPEVGVVRRQTQNQAEVAIGNGGPKLQVQTYSGDIRLRPSR